MIGTLNASSAEILNHRDPTQPGTQIVGVCATKNAHIMPQRSAQNYPV
jgi:hypothetical protein